jgi:hypothetical protein
MPPSLSSIQWLGAFSRFMCFLGPRTILATLSLTCRGSARKGPRAARAARKWCASEGLQAPPPHMQVVRASWKASYGRKLKQGGHSIGGGLGPGRRDAVARMAVNLLCPVALTRRRRANDVVYSVSAHRQH